MSAVRKIASFKAAGKFVIKAYKGADRESAGCYQVANGDHRTVISQCTQQKMGQHTCSTKMTFRPTTTAALQDKLIKKCPWKIVLLQVKVLISKLIHCFHLSVKPLMNGIMDRGHASY